MSKAGEWAARDKARIEELEIARDRIDVELGLVGKDKPGPFLNNASVIAEVTHHDGRPHAVLRVYHSPLVLDVTRSLEFARWILDTFGEEAQ